MLDTTKSFYLQQQSHSILLQKSQIQTLLRENEGAITALENSPEDAIVYQSVGGIILRSNKIQLMTDLMHQNDVLNARLSVLSVQEDRLRIKSEL